MATTAFSPGTSQTGASNMSKAAQYLPENDTRNVGLLAIAWTRNNWWNQNRFDLIGFYQWNIISFIRVHTTTAAHIVNKKHWLLSGNHWLQLLFLPHERLITLQLDQKKAKRKCAKGCVYVHVAISYSLLFIKICIFSSFTLNIQTPKRNKNIFFPKCTCQPLHIAATCIDDKILNL